MQFAEKLIKKSFTIFDFILDAFIFLSAVILAFIMLSVCWDVIARAVASKPLKWALEFSEYSLLYICFLGAAWVLKKERHVTSDLLLIRLKPKNQAFLAIITSVIGAIVCMILTWFGADVAIEKLQIGAFQPTVIKPPDFPLFIIIPIGYCLISIQFLRRAYKNLQFWKSSKDQS